MDKSDYILRSLSKVTSKRWEHYIINRIFHRLDDPEIEFICQQCVRKGERYYLADIYFPQFGLYLEIDEAHHERDSEVVKDARRRLDIAESAGLEEARISTNDKSVEDIDREVEGFIDDLRRRKASSHGFIAWDHDQRYKPEQHIERGHIEIGPHAVFRYQRDALACFGYKKGHYQRGAWDIPASIAAQIGLPEKSMVWFPRLYEQERWINSLSEDGLEIIEINRKPEDSYREKWSYRIVMARSRNTLNQTLYRFVGVFSAVPEYSSGNERRFRRISEQVKTMSGTEPVGKEK